MSVGNLNSSPFNGTYTEPAALTAAGTAIKVPRTNANAGRLIVTARTGTLYFKVGPATAPTISTTDYTDKVASTDNPRSIVFNFHSGVNVWVWSDTAATWAVLEAE